MMCEIIIDEEFKALMPPLDKQTYALLEESLLEYGCMYPLILWKGILIDGHNRYEIIQQHNLPFYTIQKEFATREEALIWIISTQVARRNLTPIQLSYFRGLHYNADKRSVKNEAGTNQYSEVSGHNDHKPQSQSTAGRLAEQYNVSSRTIRRDAQIAAAINAIGEASPEAKREILSGAAGITQKHLRELAGGPDEAVRDTAKSIAEGTFELRRAGDAESARDTMETLNAAIAKMADEFSNAVHRLKNEVEADELKAALRGHIDTLEALYRQI